MCALGRLLTEEEKNAVLARKPTRGRELTQSELSKFLASKQSAEPKPDFPMGRMEEAFRKPPKDSWDLPYQRLIPPEKRKPYKIRPERDRSPMEQALHTLRMSDERIAATIRGTQRGLRRTAVAAGGTVAGIPYIGSMAKAKGLEEPPETDRLGRVAFAGGRALGFIASAAALGAAAVPVFVSDAFLNAPKGKKLKSAALTWGMLKIFQIAGRAGDAIYKAYGTDLFKKALITTGEGATTGGMIFGIEKLFGAPTDEALSSSAVFAIVPRPLRRFLKAMFGADRSLPPEVSETVAKEVARSIAEDRPINEVRLRKELGEIKKAEKPTVKQPLVREVGVDIEADFLHGTARKNIPFLAAKERPAGTEKKGTKIDWLVGKEQNEFGAELLLSEFRQPQQASMWSQGRGNALAVVKIKPGTKVLDLTAEVTRAPTIVLGDEPRILRFFKRPTIVDDMIEFRKGRIVEGYKQRNPNWEKMVSEELDPSNPNFRVESWQDTLVPYAKSKGYGLIRFADETLLVDRAVLSSARVATQKERVLAKTTRTFAGGKAASLFTDQPVGEKPTVPKRPPEAEEPKVAEDILRASAGLPTMAEARPRGPTKPPKPPTDKSFEEMSPEERGDASRRVIEQYKAGDVALEAKYKMSWPRMMSWIARKWWNPSDNLEAAVEKLSPNLGKIISDRIALARGATPWSKVVMEEAYPQIYSEITPPLREALNWVVRSRDTVAISREDVKHPGGRSREEHRAFLEEFKKDFSTEDWAKVDRAADEIFKVTRETLNEMVERGALGASERDKMVAARPEYLSRDFIEQHIDPEYSAEFFDQPIRYSGMPKLKEGSGGALVNDSLHLLEQYVTRAHRRVANNDVLNELDKFAWLEARKAKAQGRPNETFVRPWQAGVSKPTGYSELAPRRNFGPNKGKERKFWIQDEMAKELIFKEPGLSRTMLNVLNIVTGSAVLKRFATGINWAFAAVNPWRDLQYIFLRTKEYSTNPIKAAKQMREDFATVWRDGVKQRGKWYNIYGKNGGLMDWMTRIGMHRYRPVKPTKHYHAYEGKMKFLRELGSWPGDISELTPRLMLMRRGILNRTEAFRKKYGHKPNTKQLQRIHRAAVATARSYLDFAVAGSWAKTVDAIFPYFNPRVQGMRGTLRAIRRDPATTLPKIAELIAIRASLTIANIILNPEAWLDTTDHDKSSNWIFNTPLKFKDRRKNIINYLMKFPLSPDHKIIAAIADALAHQVMGLPVNKEQLATGLKETLVFLPEQAGPPMQTAIMGYIFNKNWWRNTEIWKGDPNVAPHMQRDESTHPWIAHTSDVFAKAGIEISPMRLQYAASQVFPASNFFLDFLGKTTKTITEWPTIPEEERDAYTKEILGRLPLAGRFLDTTSPYQRIRKETQPEIEAEATRTELQRQELKPLIQEYRTAKSAEAQAKIREYITSQPILDRARLIRQVMRETKFFDVDPPVGQAAWWRNLLNPRMRVSVRARIFYSKYSSASPENQEKMVTFAGEIGLITPQFAAHMDKLVSE